MPPYPHYNPRLMPLHPLLRTCATPTTSFACFNHSPHHNPPVPTISCYSSIYLLLVKLVKHFCWMLPRYLQWRCYTYLALGGDHRHKMRIRLTGHGSIPFPIINFPFGCWPPLCGRAHPLFTLRKPWPQNGIRARGPRTLKIKSPCRWQRASGERSADVASGLSHNRHLFEGPLSSFLWGHACSHGVPLLTGGLGRR